MVDLVICNDSYIHVEVLDFPKITDHDIIVIRPSVSDINLSGRTVVKKRFINQKNLKLMGGELIGKQWVYESDDVNFLVNNFRNNLLEVLNKFAPNKIVKSKHLSNPWFNKNIRNIQQERNMAYKNFKSTNDHRYWLLYKRKRNELVRAIRNQKELYLNKKIDSQKHNSKKMWETLKTIIGKPKSSVSNNINFENFGMENESIPDRLNFYFINSLINIVKDINAPEFVNINIASHDTNNLPHFTKINLIELKKLIKTEKCTSSPDEITALLVNELFQVVGYPLLHIVNSSLEKGIFPDELKINTVIPIPKISNTIKVSEMRPINLLPFCEKVLERVVYQQLVTYFESNQLFYKFQSGFRSKHSCETAIQYLITEWKCDLDSNKVILATFLDLRRAFETVDRQILIDKLRKYGVKELALSWLESYLANRRQIVKFNNVTSKEALIEYGVPQGSVLGPLLFLIYINDIFSSITNCKIILFADDALIYVSADNANDCYAQMNFDLNKLEVWLQNNKLKLNTDKTKYMFIASKTSKSKFKEDLKNNNIIIQGKKIEFVNEIKYLGVIIDSNLNFNKHCDFICKKVSKKIGFLCRVAESLSLWSRVTVYSTIIAPHFQYCNTIFFCFNDYQLKKLQLLQNRAMRIILRCNRLTSINKMLETLNWLSIKERVIFSTMIFLYKVTNNLLPNYLMQFVQRNNEIHRYNTRTNNQFRIALSTKSATQKTVFQDGVKLFNNLPDKVKSVNTVFKFKNAYLKHVKSQISDL